MIKTFTLGANADAKTFTEELKKVIDEIQGLGYEVDVQYSTNNNYFSALVIAKGKC